MPWSGSAPNQTFSRSDGTRTGTTVWQQADGAGVDIIPTDHDTHDQDLATGINAAVKKDGGNTPSANLPMGGFRHTGVGDATALTQYLTLKQRYNGVGEYVATVAGTANAITLTTGFTLTAYAAGQTFTFLVGSSNTGAATVNVDSLGAKTLLRQDGSALQSTDLQANAFATISYDGTNFKLINRRFDDGGSSDILARIVSVGTVMAWPTATVPAGWLECNGAAISRTTYSDLYAKLGTIYGAGDGSTTFNLPDYRGEFLRGHDNSAGNDPDAASRTNRGDGTTGDAVGTKQAAATGSHTHAAGTLATASDGAHTHTFKYNNIGAQTLATSVVQDISTASGSFTVTTSSNGAHTHTISGSTGSTGGNETRGRNVAVKFIILALPALASAAHTGVNGLFYTWDTGTTDADPGAGKLRVNNASLSSATELYISETGANSESLGAVIQQWDDSTNTNKGLLYFYKVGTLSTYAIYTVTGSVTDAGAYDKVTLTHVSSNGTFAAGDQLSVLFYRSGDKGADGSAGSTGATGAAGPNTGMDYAWDTGTTDADPGSGDIRVDNATLASATFAYISKTDRAGNSQGTHIGTWDDSTNTAHRGTLRVFDVATKAKGFTAEVTSTFTDGTTYWKIPLASVTALSGGAPSAADVLAVMWHRTGNVGAAGSNGTDGVNAGFKWTYSTTTTMADPGSGVVRFNNATLASVTAIAIDDLSADTGNPDVSAHVLTWDDSTNTAHRGTLRFHKASAPANWVEYAVTGLTDNSGWTELAVTYVGTAGTLANSDTLVGVFTRTGNKGADGAGAGDVVGPASSTNNSLARFDGTTGKLLKDGAVIGTDVQAYDATLAALAAHNTNGLITQTAADTFAGRTITGTTNQITVSDGNGVLGNPTLSLPADVVIPTVITTPNTGLHLLDTNASHDLIIAPGSDLTADRTLTLTTGDASRTITINGNPTLADWFDQSVKTTANPQFATIELGAAADTTISRTAAGAIAVEGVGVALNSTSLAHTAGTIELGHATDTTLSRSAAGRLAVEGKDALLKGQADTLTTGFSVTPNNIGTISSGTVTPDPALGNYQYYTNNGAHTMAVPGSDCAIDILVTNGASAGSITISGSYTAPSGGGGDTYATTNANKYLFMIRRINGISTYAWKALQ